MATGNRGLVYGLTVCLLLAAYQLNYHGVNSDSTSNNSSGAVSDHMTGNESEHEGGGVTVAGINFGEVKTPFLITMVVLLCALSKIGFHHAHFLSSLVPESCLLIVVGVVLGAILHFSGAADHLPNFFTPHEFFLYLLPPIILEASFSLHDRVFFNNLGGILLFAVVGTVLACFIVGYTMYGLAKVGAMGEINIGLVEMLIFAALIVAVDPVAVLAVFDEIGVNSVLYFMVFGESLLNDGVTVVIYKVMQEFNEMETTDAGQIFLGILAFVVVVGGGLLLGILVGVLSAIVTKYTSNVRVVEPIAVFGFAYLSYIVAEIFEFSGIISMVACGLVQMQYTFCNITPKSRTTIKYFSKVISTATEIVIFLFLGLALVRPDHVFHVGFTLWAIFLTLFFRFIITYGLSFMLNKFDVYRVRQITLEEQFIMSYGGLRGAVCFSLVAMLEDDQVTSKQMFVTTTLAVIIFTVFIQGITIKPLVSLLEITLSSTEKPSLYQELNHQVTDHLMAGVEDIVGFHGKYHLKEWLQYYDDRYLKKWLQKNPERADEEIMRIYQKLALREHVEYLYASGAVKIPSSPAVIRALPHRGSVHTLFSGLFQLDEDSSSSQADAPSFRSTYRPESVFSRVLDEEESESLFDEQQAVPPSTRRRFKGRQGVTRDQILTYKDLRKYLVKNPSRMLMHMKYDPDIVQDNKTDLVQHLHDKHLRKERLQRHTLSVRRPSLERCFSWSVQNQPDPSIMRHFKTMSLDYDRGHSADNHQASFLPPRPLQEQEGMLQRIHEDNELSIDDEGSSNGQMRSPFMRSDAFCEEEKEDGENQDKSIALSNLNKRNHTADV